MNKRYSIVRVNGTCPFYRELVTTKCWIYKNDKSCFKCKIKKNYGDTKEQLIKKVATAMKRAVKKATKKNIFIVCDEEKIPICIFIENVLAKEIVEFLGVE